MAQVVITLKVMPVSPEADLAKIEEVAKKLISEHGAEVGKVEIEPVAFGLKAVNLIFVMDESKGSTDELEEKVQAIDQVQSVEVTDVGRAVG